MFSGGEDGGEDTAVSYVCIVLALYPGFSRMTGVGAVCGLSVDFPLGANIFVLLL
jgi:hypothetical protein